MSLVSVKDFGLALNISGGTIRSKISRGQLLRNKKNLIDTENPINYIYILEINGGDQSVFEKYHIQSSNRTNVHKKSITPRKNITKVSNISKKDNSVVKNEQISKKTDFEKPSNDKGSVNVAPTVDTEKKTIKKVFEKPERLTAEEKRVIQEEQKARAKLYEYELRKKEADVRLVERNAELKQMELEKKAGNTLPLDQITNLMTINYKAIFKSIHSQIKNIATVMVQQLGGSKDDLNTILIELEQILDTTVQDSKKKSEVDLKKLIEEYSDVSSKPK